MIFFQNLLLRHQQKQAKDIKLLPPKPPEQKKQPVCDSSHKEECQLTGTKQSGNKLNIHIGDDDATSPTELFNQFKSSTPRHLSPRDISPILREESPRNDSRRHVTDLHDDDMKKIELMTTRDHSP